MDRWSVGEEPTAHNTANNDVTKAHAKSKVRSILLFAEMRIMCSQKYCVVCRHVMCHCGAAFSNLIQGRLMIAFLSHLSNGQLPEEPL
jgi:hypothetical protein